MWEEENIFMHKWENQLWGFYAAFKSYKQQSVKTEGVKRRGVGFFCCCFFSWNCVIIVRIAFAPNQWNQDQSVSSEGPRFVAPSFKVLIAHFCLLINVTFVTLFHPQTLSFIPSCIAWGALIILGINAHEMTYFTLTNSAA